MTKSASRSPGRAASHVPASAARPSAAASGGAGRAAVLGTRGAACVCGGGCPRCVQPKLKLDTPGDRWECEADRVAEAVLAGGAIVGVSAASPAAGGSAGMPAVQRVSGSVSPEAGDAGRRDGGEATEEEDDADTAASPDVQRLFAGAAAGAGDAGLPHAGWAAGLNRGGGAPLPAPLAAELGRRIGADFSPVRVHADAGAARLCDGIAARAFTHGRDLYFNRGEYRPDTRGGLRVLAHELAHVVQQGAADASPASAQAPPLQRMAALDRTSPTTLHDTNVQPWKELPDTRGDEYVVQTDAGSSVLAWVPYRDVPADTRYWCHGFSLGTYARWGYSVWSGSQMGKVVADEYRRIPREQASAGDLAVWVLMPDGRLYGHSALFTQPVVRDGSLDTTQSRLDTKNGAAPQANRTLAEIMAVPAYGYNVAVYRHV